MHNKALNKANHVLFFGSIIIVALYFGAPFFIPLAFAIFFATLILPVTEIMERKLGWGKITSSFISTFIIFIGVGVIFFFLFYQLGAFLKDIVERKEELMRFSQNLQEAITSLTGFSPKEQQEIFKEQSEGIFQHIQESISHILSNISIVILKFLLMLIYLFLLLLNRGKFVKFLMMYVPEEKKPETRQIIEQTSKVAHHYLWGRIQVMSLLAIMYLITFISFDLEHTGLLVLFGAVITIIPYLGPFLSGILPIAFMAIFGDDLFEIILFASIVFIIQLIESYILEPVIIGSEVKQSPLSVIVAILLGGMIWGPSGLILFVPLFAIAKILFDHTSDLKPVGYLLGYERPGAGEGFAEKIKKLFKRS